MGSQENLCKARGCEHCCWNTFLGMSSDNFTLFKTEVESRGVDVDLLSAESFRVIQALVTRSPGKKLVVYCEEHNQGAQILVQIVRDCVFLTDGNCDLINSPARPLGCEGVVFDGTACKRISSGKFTFISADTIE